MTGSAPPRSRRPIHRLTRSLLAFVCRALFRVRLHGLSNLPVGAGRGWICCAVPHRNWVEPLVVAALLPVDRPFVFVADAPTVSRSLWRRLAVRAVGHVVPISRRPGTADFAGHLDVVSEAIDASAVVAIFSEVGPPSVPPRLRRLAPGVAHFARQTQAAVVPVVFGGTHELYLSRRIEVFVLPPLDPPPARASRADTADFMARLTDKVEEAARQAHERAERDTPRRKRWLWLTGNYPRAE